MIMLMIITIIIIMIMTTTMTIAMMTMVTVTKMKMTTMNAVMMTLTCDHDGGYDDNAAILVIIAMITIMNIEILNSNTYCIRYCNEW